jgi:hypothetical protein
MVVAGNTPLDLEVGGLSSFGSMSTSGGWTSGMYVSLADSSGASNVVYYGTLIVDTPQAGTTYVMLNPISSVSGQTVSGQVSNSWTMTYISDTPPAGPV